jgi:hypothetical protein
MDTQPSHPDLPCSFSEPRVQRQLVIFALLTVAYLTPIWAFPYLPTQDGPIHLANAIILKDYRKPGARYAEFFELRWELLPNWTTHLLLAGLMHVVPPLIAEKILASLYVIGFSWSFRYFLGAFGESTLRLAPVVFLFLFNRCFLMGFYNYCLSLIFFWLVLGYCLRCRQRFGAAESLVLLAVWPLAYFTHLLGYALAAAGAVWVLVTAPYQRWRKLLWVSGSLLPTAWLAFTALVRPDFLGLSEAASRGGGLFRAWAPKGWESLRSDIEGMGQQLFEPYEAGVPLEVFILLLYETVVFSALFTPRQNHGQTRFGPGRLPVAFLGVLLGSLYIVLPDFPSLAVGFLKARLALLPALVCLACLRLPPAGVLRRGLELSLYLLLGVNLGLVARHFQVANRDLHEFTAGVDRVGYGRVLFITQSFRGKPLVNHLEHAADYYCLTTGNVNLDNFQATLRHFPVRFRSGVQRGIGSFDTYPNRDAVGVILAWNEMPNNSAESAGPFREIYREGRLRIFENTRLTDGRGRLTNQPEMGGTRSRSQSMGANDRWCVRRHSGYSRARSSGVSLYHTSRSSSSRTSGTVSEMNRDSYFPTRRPHRPRAEVTSRRNNRAVRYSVPMGGDVWRTHFQHVTLPAIVNQCAARAAGLERKRKVYQCKNLLQIVTRCAAQWVTALSARK